MDWRSAIKKVFRPGAKAVTDVVTRAIGPRIAALEHAHGKTRVDVDQLQALPRPDERLAALEAAQKETRREVEDLRASIAGILDAVARQHATTRAAVRAEHELRQVAEELHKRLEQLDASPAEGP